MSLDETRREAWLAMQDQNRREEDRRGDAELPLLGGGGGSISGGMEARVTRLEVQMEMVGKALGSIDGKLDRVNDRLLQLPTKSELYTLRWQWVLGAVALVAVIVGGIIGGLSWIQPAPPTPTPIIVQAAPLAR